MSDLKKKFKNMKGFIPEECLQKILEENKNLSSFEKDLFSFWAFKKLLPGPSDCKHLSLIKDICLVCGKHKKEFIN